MQFPIKLLCLALSLSLLTFSSFGNEDKFRTLPIGSYLLTRPCVLIGTPICTNGYTMKIKVEEWLKGNGGKRIKVWHNNLISNSKVAKHEMESNLRKTFLFVLRAKNNKSRHLQTRQDVFFEVVNDSIRIPPRFFEILGGVTEENKSIAKDVKDHGIQLSLTYFKWIIKVVNEAFILGNKVKDGESKCYYYREPPIILDDFAQLIVNDLKSRACE